MSLAKIILLLDIIVARLKQQHFLSHFNSEEQTTYTAEHRLYNYLQNAE